MLLQICSTIYFSGFSVESDPLQLRVAVGSSKRLSGGEVYDVKTIYVHEKYSSLTLEHDIAMIVTSTKMKFDKNVGAVFIPEPNFRLPVGTVALVSGYGVTTVSIRVYRTTT